MLPGTSDIASGKRRDEQEGTPGVFRCGSDATRMVSMLVEDCMPNMRKRIGRRRVGMVKGECRAPPSIRRPNPELTHRNCSPD